MRVLPFKRGILKLLFVVLASVLFIRGSFDTKPITVANAFIGSHEQGLLSLNGVFTSYIYTRHKDAAHINHNFYSFDEARGILGLKRSEYPLEKSYDLNKTGLNVVFVLLESWTPAFIDSFAESGAGGRGQKNELTPNFDALAQNGARFVNFFASGQRSIEGIQASLTGVAPVKTLPFMGFGLELSKLTRIGEILTKNGYDSIMMQTSKRGSFYVNLIAASLGVQKYFGKEDMPPVLDYPDKKGAYFGWDYEGYMKLFDEIDKTDKPFFAFLFTGSTHTEYPRMQPRFEKLPYDGTRGENAFKNMMYYSDWALGEFMKKARTRAWFDNTVFIFTSDHMSGFGAANFRQEFRTPCVIYSPKHIKPQTITQYSSQIQILPTIIHLLGFSDPFYTLSNSLFMPSSDASVQVFAGDTVGVIGDGAELLNSYGKRIQSSFDANETRDKEQKLLATIQVVTELVKKNKLAR